MEPQNETLVEEPILSHSQSTTVQFSSRDNKKKRGAQTSLKTPPGKKAKTENCQETNQTKAVSKDNAFLTTDTSFLEQFRSENNITVEGPITNFKPFLSFSEGNFPSEFLETTKSFSKPTPIQSQCWPILLSGHDVVGIATTGSGKTLAFGFPGLCTIKEKISTQNLKSGTILMLVLAPTRELAMQTEKAFQGVKGISVACVYGGVSKNIQRKAIYRASVIVATPGRLLDFISEGKLDLGQVCYLVLDEADQMLDMGFEKDINLILSYCPPKSCRQTSMFSATWPKAIQKLAASFLTNPIRVSIGSRDLAGNPNVTQIVEVIGSDQRFDRLEALLSSYHADGKNRILVFTLYKKETTWLENSLWNRGWNVASIHSNLSQARRISALKEFTTGKVPLLIATDVASRGLDIPSVEYVINFTFPQTIQSYVHRIGRTGRAGAKGISHTFFMLQDKSHAGALVNILKETNQTIPPQLLQFDCSVKKRQPTLGKIDLQQNKSHITFDDSSDDDSSE